MRTWWIALAVVGCGSGADTRVAPSSAPPPGLAIAPAPAPPPLHDTAGELPIAPDAAPPPDAAIAIDAPQGGFASIDVSSGFDITSGLKLADGDPCDGSATVDQGRFSECASGVCEGVGCPGERVETSRGWDGLTPTGSCAPSRRSCTRDRRAYCGCDGKTFFASSSCPGRRFASVGACPGR